MEEKEVRFHLENETNIALTWISYFNYITKLQLITHNTLNSNLFIREWFESIENSKLQPVTY